MIDLWKSYDRRLKENLVLNKKNVEEMMKIKTRSALLPMQPNKIFTVIIGIVWVGLGGLFLTNLCIYAFEKVSIFFLVSAGLQLLITAIAIVIYIVQLVLIKQLDINKSVLDTQEKLAYLKNSTLWVARILFLQLPLWTTFYLSENLFRSSHIIFYIIQGSTTALFGYVAVWLFFNIKYENRDKSWFRMIFKGKEWDPLLKSMDILAQIQDYKEAK